MKFITAFFDAGHLFKAQLNIHLRLICIAHSMKNTGYEKYLSRYYKREAALFLSDLNKAKLFPNEKNIHQLRVDIKRMRAVFSLLEMLFPKKFKAKEHTAVFK